MTHIVKFSGTNSHEPDLIQESELQKLISNFAYKNEEIETTEVFENIDSIKVEENIIDDPSMEDLKIEIINHCINLESVNDGQFEADRDLPDNTTIIEILKQSSEGKVILDSGKKRGGRLDHLQRNTLSKLIIMYHLERNPDMIAGSQQFSRWANEIVSIFPEESCSTYFESRPGITKRASNQTNYLGKLFYWYSHRKKLLNEMAAVKKKNLLKLIACKPSSSRPSSSRPSTYKSQPFSPEGILQEKLVFLKESVGPWHVVSRYWKETGNVRLVGDYVGNLAKYFNDFPALRQPTGYTLLMEDFDHLFGSTKSSLFRSITLAQTRIKDMARQRYVSLGDDEVGYIIKQHLFLTNENGEAQINGVLLLLPFLAPRPSIKKNQQSNTTYYKPTRFEMRDAFIIQVDTEANMHAAILSRKEKLPENKFFQPMIFFVGSSFAKISSVFVVVGDVYYKVPTLLSAVDKAFKIFHVTGCKYPEEAETVWMIIQKGFYRIKTVNDKTNTAVDMCLEDIGIKN